jgi:hypothetical protein
LAELRTATGLACSLPAIYYALARLHLTYKKRHSAPVNRLAPTLRRHGRRGRPRHRSGM